MLDSHTEREASSAADEASDILRFVRSRADTGDLMMSVVADHIEELERKLRELKSRMEAQR